MSADEKIVDEKHSHPLEDVFDIEQQSTNMPTVQRDTDLVDATTDATVKHPYDNKDSEIDGQFQEVYDTAMEAFSTQAQEAELVEGRYKARNQEIAVQFLNTALNAAANKGTLKNNKEKLAIAALKVKTGTGNTTNNNMVVGDRNEILRALREKKAAQDDIIEGEVTEIPDK